MNTNMPGYSSPQPPTGQGFFSNLRYSGWFRGEPRIVGGVCQGLAARYGWDTNLVRGVVAISALFFAPVMFVYALAWAFLPEQRDGRIHAEAFFHGHMDIAQAGAASLAMLAMLRLAGFDLLTSGITSWLRVLLMLALFPLAILLVVLMSRQNQRPRPAPFIPTQPQGNVPFSSPTSPSASSFTGVPTSFPLHEAYIPTPSAQESAMGTVPPSSEHPDNLNTEVLPVTDDPPVDGVSVDGVSPSASSASSPTADGDPLSVDWRTQGGPVSANGSGNAYATNASYAPAGQTPGVPQGAFHAAPGFSSSQQTPPGVSPSSVPPMGGYASATPQGHIPGGAIPQIQVPRIVLPTHRPRRVSRQVSLAISGLILILMAAGFGGMYAYSHNPAQVITSALLSGGACLLVVGIALAVAAIRDRGSAWLMSLSIIGMFMATPLLAAGTSRVYNLDEQVTSISASTSPQTDRSLSLSVPFASLSSEEKSWEYDSLGSSETERQILRLDLASAPDGLTKDIHVTGSEFLALSIEARKDQPFRVVFNHLPKKHNISYWESAGSPATSYEWTEVNGSRQFANEAWSHSGGQGITVFIDPPVNFFTLHEKDPATPRAPRPEQSATPSATPAPTASAQQPSSSPSAPAESH